MVGRRTDHVVPRRLGSRGPPYSEPFQRIRIELDTVPSRIRWDAISVVALQRPLQERLHLRDVLHEHAVRDRRRDRDAQFWRYMGSDRKIGRGSEVAHGHRIRDAAHACHVGLQNVQGLPSDGVGKGRWTVEAFAARSRRGDVLSQSVESRKIGRLGTSFYASRDYAARRRLPERRDEWKGHSIIGFADQASNVHLARWSDFVTRQRSIVMRCSSQGDMLAAVRAGLGISALSCFVAAAYPDLVRVAPRKLASVSDLWLLAHPDLVELPAVRAVIDFVADCARIDRVALGG